MAELKVTITDETGGQTSTSLPSTSKEQNPTPQQQAAKTASAKTKAANDTKQNSSVMAAATMIGSQALNYCTSNIGKWSGDSNNQTMVNQTKEVVSFAAAAYVNPYLAVAALAVKVATTAIDDGYDLKMSSQRSSNMLAKAGYSSSGSIVGRRH